MAVDVFERPGAKPERFVPLEMQGHLIEAEHLARYRWATRLVPAGRILDAGCGLAYGTKMLAQSGADQVVGMDIAGAVLDSARPDMPPNVRLEVGDIRELPYEDKSFDAVVCFEVIAQLDEPGRGLDELARVLAPEGLLVVSSSTRAIDPRIHGHQFLAQELADEVSKRLRNVRLMRQQNYLGSAILTDQVYGARSEDPIQGLPAHKLVPGSADGEAFTLAIGSDGALPEPPMVTMLTGTADLQQLLDFFHEQDDRLKSQEQRIHDLEQQLLNRREVEDRLIEIEQEIGGANFPASLDEARHEIAQLRDRLEGTRRILEDVLNSPSWRWTTPLRTLKKLLEDRP